jgi:hypothetical protein
MTSLRFAAAPAASQTGWPAGATSIAPPAPHPGQIAQLKAQLACLSQQLDHLLGGE